MIKIEDGKIINPEPNCLKPEKEKEPKIFYAVTVIKKSHKVSIPYFTTGAICDLELTWADGMIGVLPIFSSREDALKYADGDEDLIIELVRVK